MKRLTAFSLTRWWSIVLKEFLQLRRDRVTFGMIVGLPIVQLALFGFAINTDPKHLPTAVIVGDEQRVLAQLRRGDEELRLFRFRRDAARRGSRPRAHSRRDACSSC